MGRARPVNGFNLVSVCGGSGRDGNISNDARRRAGRGASNLRKSGRRLRKSAEQTNGADYRKRCTRWVHGLPGPRVRTAR